MDDKTLIQRACMDYHRRFGEQAPIPAMGSSQVLKTDDGIVVRLQNVNGILAEYQFKPKADKLVLLATLLHDEENEAALDREEEVEQVRRILRRLRINLRRKQIESLLEFDLLSRTTLVWDLDG